MHDAPAPLAASGSSTSPRVLAGPLATMTLADLGADVIKVERPDTGDDTRHWGPPFAGDDAAYFLCLNRNKRSAVIDLKTPNGVAALRRLAGTSDVLIENFRPGLMAELGLAPEDLRAAHPRLITCSVTAFGDETPEAASRPGYDIIVQALSGLMSVTGEPGGEPMKAGVALLDVITGLYATVGVLAAVRERELTGVGRHVSVSLFDASLAAMVNQAANHLIGGLVPRAMGTQHPNIVPYQVVHGSDRPFIVAGGNDRLFARLCDVARPPGMGRRRAVRDQRGAGAQPGGARGVADRRVRHADGGGVARGVGGRVRALRTHPYDGRGLRLARGPRRRRDGGRPGP